MKSWKILLKQAISDPHHLLSSLGLGSHPLAEQVVTQSNFRMRVPQPFIDKMGYGDPNDPLLLQVLPVNQEAQVVEGFSQDPLAEFSDEADKQPGILHKYQGRILVLLAQACAVNCRYCFRRHFPYHDHAAKSDQLEQIYDYLTRNDEISEGILSGGDPLIVSDHYFQGF
ncbi:MAG: 4Fe-4S cluster-binding domain-containing protein, partial [Kangiellaceae bacterium]|nr:4Fe-4S cluster-binding domain-containing protein [Kangiellaceae bacterium]